MQWSFIIVHDSNVNDRQQARLQINHEIIHPTIVIVLRSRHNRYYYITFCTDQLAKGQKWEDNYKESSCILTTTWSINTIMILHCWNWIVRSCYQPIYHQSVYLIRIKIYLSVQHASYQVSNINQISVIICNVISESFGQVHSQLVHDGNEYLIIINKSFGLLSWMFYISGWGMTQYPSNPSDLLQQGLLPIVSKQECIKRLHTSNGNEGLSISDEMLCAGFRDNSSAPNSDLTTCRGDSGGPLVCQESSGKWILHGVTSWGSIRYVYEKQKLWNYLIWNYLTWNVE